MNLETARMFCSEDEDRYFLKSTEKLSSRRIWARFFWIHFLSLCLCTVSFIQNCKYYYDIFKSYNRIKFLYFYKEDRIEKMKKYKLKKSA